MGQARLWRGLVADIGGTNARFALVSDERAEGMICEARSYSCGDHPDFASLLRAFLADVKVAQPLTAVMAVAGPVADNKVALTNSEFVVDGEALVTAGLLSGCRVINDFAALASSLPLLAPADLMPVGPKAPLGPETWLVVGPGTGLGAALVGSQATGRTVIEGEGGHSAFAPVDDLDIEIRRFFLSRYPRVSNERILSGQGLADLFEGLAKIEGRPVLPLTAAEIMQQGLDTAGLARDALMRFCAILGSFSGDLALIGGAFGGVFVGGGIIPRMGALFDESPFRARFEDKGRFTGRVAKVPTNVITAPLAALLGAASHLPR